MISAEKAQILKMFAEARNHYKMMDFTQALEGFAKILEMDAHDGPSKVYVDRCKHYLANPPEADWDGVFIMKNK